MKSVAYLLLLLTFLSCQKKELIPTQVKEAITSIQVKYAPDKRTSIFNVEPSYNEGHLVIKGETNYPAAKKDLLEAVGNISYLDSIELLPNASLDGYFFGVITIPVANMRSNPGHSSELSNQLLCGTVIRNYKWVHGWLYCQTPDDYLGWVDQDAIKIMDSIELNNWLNRPKIIITQDQSYLMQSASKSANVLSSLSAGAILASGDPYKDFYEAFLPDGRMGYVPGSHAQDLKLWKLKQSKPKSINEVLKTAYSYLGRPYLWGGTSGNGMDCSGFTKMVFLQHGLLLPRDASQQVKVGMPIETDTTLKNLEPGDFLFFGSRPTASQPEKVTHVAIYSGDDKIIHASGFVRVQSLRRGDSTFAEHRLNSLLRATRPFASSKEYGIPFLSDLKYFN